MKAARQAGNEELARSAEELARVMDAHRERLQVADAARLEWEEATVAKAKAATQAREELDRRGPARWDGHQPEAQAAEAREVQAGKPAASLEHEPRAETAGGIVEPEPGQEIGHADLDAEAEAEAEGWPDEVAADVDPEALTVMASAGADLTAISRSEFDDNLTHAQAGAEQLAAQRARDQAERDRAAIDEPVIHAEPQAELEAAAEADRAEADDVDLEI